MQQSASAEKPVGNSSSASSCSQPINMSSTPERMHNSWAQQRQGGGKAKPTHRAQYELGQSRLRDAQPQSSPFPALPSELSPPLPPPTESAVSAAPSVGSSDQQPMSRLKELGRSVARKISFGVLRSQQQQHEPEQAGQGEGDSGLEPSGPLARLARGVFEEEEEGSNRPLPGPGLGRITPAHNGGFLAGDTAGLQRVWAQDASQAALIESAGGEEPSVLPHAHPKQGQRQQQQQEQNPEAPPPSSFHSSVGVWERDPRVGKTIPAYYSIGSGPRSSSRYSVDVHEEVPIGYERPESVPSVPVIPARFRQEAAYPSSPVFPPQSPVLPTTSTGSGPYILVHKDELVDAYKQHLTRAIIPQIQHLTDTNNEVRSEIGRIVEERVATLLGDFHEHLDQRFGQMRINREVVPQPPRRRLTASSDSDAPSVRRADSTTGAQAYEARRQHRQHARQQQRQHVAADEQDSILRTTQHLLQRFGTMQTNQNQLNSEVGTMRHEIADINRGLGDLKRDFAALAKNVASTSHPGSASELQRQTAAAMQELAIIRNDVQAARVEIGAVRNDIATVSDHANAARLETEEARADMQDNAAESEGGFNVIADMIKSLQRNVADIGSDSRTRGSDRSSPYTRHQRQHSRRDFLEGQRRFRPPSGPITPFAPVPPVPRYDPPAPPVGAHGTSAISGLASASASAPTTAPPIAFATALDDTTAAIEEQSFTSFLPLQIPSTPPPPRTSAETTQMQTESSLGSNNNNDANVEESKSIAHERAATMYHGTTVASSTTTAFTSAPAPVYAAPASLPNTTYQEQSRSASSGRVAEMANVFEGNGRFASSSSDRLQMRELLRRRQERGQGGEHRD